MNSCMSLIILLTVTTQISAIQEGIFHITAQLAVSTSLMVHIEEMITAIHSDIIWLYFKLIQIQSLHQKITLIVLKNFAICS